MNLKTGSFNKSVLILIGILTFIGCTKEYDFGGIKNAVKTVGFNNVTQTSVEVSGSVDTAYGTTLSNTGICYSFKVNPTIDGLSKKSITANLGAFSCTLKYLSPSTTYFARAFATNDDGTAYGKLVTFTTLAATVPIISSTTAPNLVTTTTAKTGGIISDSGASNVISRGVCYSSIANIPTIANTKTNDGSGIGSFVSFLFGLSANTTYYIRAYATNDVGTAYGDVKSFSTTTATIPNGITTTTPSIITQTTASSGGSIGDDGGAEITMKGVCWSNTTSMPTISNSKINNGTGIASFSSSLNSLIANTTYFVRAYALNSVGVGYGNTITFTTLPHLVLGQSYQGGIIAYIYVAGDSGYIAGETHGLITTTLNQSAGAQWGCSGTSITGTNLALGTGLANTTAIVSGCSSITSAAVLCNNLTTNGYSDWYLPSRDELNKIYINKVIIGGFNNSSYWCSSQVSTTTAWSINFSTGIASSTTSKTSSLYVRGTRKF